ncbi:MAG: membrane protein insertase YidC [Bacteroidales bacterium]|nr:membrane protein insertase YidC [Bacteroidales bacterium]
MDRNSVIGLVLIGALFVGYMFYNNQLVEKQNEKIYTLHKKQADSVLVIANNMYQKGMDNFELSKKDTVKSDSLKNVVAIQLPDAFKKYEMAKTQYLKAGAANKKDTDIPVVIKKIERLQYQVDSIMKNEILTDNLIGVNNASDTTKVIDNGLPVVLDSGATALAIDQTTKSQEIDTFILENNKMQAAIINRGGKIESVMLKEYLKHSKFENRELFLFQGDSNIFDLQFYLNRKLFNTEDKYFETNGIQKTENGSELSMFLYFDTLKTVYLEFVYELPEDGYMLNYSIKSQGLPDLTSNQSPALIHWKHKLPALEKGYLNENNFTGVYYLEDENVDYLSEMSDGEEVLNAAVKWISFKHQFFSSIIIADQHFPDAKVIQKKLDDPKQEYLKIMEANITVPPFDQESKSVGMKFYFGPNKFNILRAQGEEYQFTEMIPLGWGFLGWINQYIVIPVFNFLEGSIVNYGLIILILTLLLKLVLFPLTYRSYISTAKMRVIKPQLDEAIAKIPKEKMQERQQATMAFYRKVGVSPLGGCLPMLVQMPILIALFRFFPASFELRQQPFLWADDLSAFDSVASLPFSIPFYGDHVSLFTLLMTISTIIYTRMNSQMTSGQQMPGMKVMMYIFPIMFLFFLNSYASGLSYYYLLANLITFGQMFIIRKFIINDEKILSKLEAAKKKPVKKSKWAERLEEAQKKRMQQTKKR